MQDFMAVACPDPLVGKRDLTFPSASVLLHPGIAMACCKQTHLLTSCSPFELVLLLLMVLEKLSRCLFHPKLFCDLMIHFSAAKEPSLGLLWLFLEGVVPRYSNIWQDPVPYRPNFSSVLQAGFLSRARRRLMIIWAALQIQCNVYSG